jgi:hypothetical protein
MFSPPGPFIVLCSHCKTDTAHRSRRVGVLEFLASQVGYYPYRCSICSRRFQQLGSSIPRRAAPVTGTEKEIAITQGASRGKQRQREMWLYGSALTLFVVLLYFLTRAPSIGD